MSKLDELIKNLCPNGVDYQKLSDIAEYGKNRIDAAFVDSRNYIGVDNLLPNKQGKTDSTYVPNDGKLIHFVTNDILIGNIRPYLKKIWMAEYDGGTNGDVLVVHITRDGLEPKFLYYCLSSDQFFHYDMQFSKGAKMPRGDKKAIMEYKVPLPPPEIQREIVHILDNFTELAAELAAELVARKQQYEYYQNELLTFGEIKSEEKTLAEIANFKTGTKPDKILEDYTDNAFYYVNAGTTPSGYVMSTNKEGDTVTTPSRGQGGIGFVGYQDKPFWLGPLCYGIRTKNPDRVITKYIYHCLRNQANDILARKKEGGTPSLNATDLGTIKIAIPDFEIQRKIVDVLDNFETICNDLNIGLPAEIEVRKQQYEFYRDLLLTFVETGNTILIDRQTDRQTEHN